MKRLALLLFFVSFTILSFGQENCENGIDDDGDGKIDLNDIDCVCQNTTISSLVI